MADHNSRLYVNRREPRVVVTKTMYNVSFIDRDGNRVMQGPNQGRYMKATLEEAQQAAIDIVKTNGEARLASIFGAQAIGTFRADAFECYEHGDAVSIYVKDDES